MKSLTQKMLDRIIATKSFINNYPKPGVVFLAMDSLFNNAEFRNIVAEATAAAIDPASFDSVASIASRGYIFSGIIANRFTNKGENFIQKVKAKGDANYVQIDIKTEYSSDSLQVLKNTIEKGKKYLLTDDLIATGGSVLNAIKLIKACGGEVDTVFVMTELLDFDARAKLKEEGVELISLLSFTNQDLQKLLHIQQCYIENPTTPLTYKLSHHEKGTQALIRSANTNNLTVHLASESPLKTEATTLAFQSMFDPLTVEVAGHATQSGVNNQPYGYDETMQGAANRLMSIQDGIPTSDDTILVSIENGLRYSEEEHAYYDFVHIIVKKGDLTFTHTQDCCKVSPDIVNAISKDKDGLFTETWGDVTKRMGISKQSNNPHQEACFGGISRTNHLTSALNHALGKLKTQMMVNNPPEIEDEQFRISRLVNINSNRSRKKYAKRGVLFAPPPVSSVSKPVDLYNQGCPLPAWNTDSEKSKRTSFKVFSTGDAFSILSQDVKINGSDINIHVGVVHSSYSPLVLLQEALQLCRCAYEHGAGEITIALPEQFHPALHQNDFNLLLISLFKASGANKLYYYDKNYRGTLNQTNANDIMSVTLSQNADPDHYQISRKDLLGYLQISDKSNLDEQVMHLTRKNRLSRAWSKFDIDQTRVIENLSSSDAPSQMQIPADSMRPHVLLCCSANKPLAEKIAASFRERGESVKLYHIDGKGEQAKIPHDANICGAVVTIVQSTRPNPDNIDETNEYQINGASAYFFETAIIARQARLRGAETVNLINPYQYSARSDKAEDNPHGKTGAYVQQNGRLLEAAGINHVVTAECHDTHTLSGSYTGKNIKGSAVPALTIISTKIARDWIHDSEHSRRGQLRLVTPDAGATKRTKELTMKLQAILGNKLSETRILGDKQRDSHQDDSASINSLDAGANGINPNDKFVITDDETATGTTLCQAITSLTNQGAKDISVIVVHNNMPLDWLSRQLCLSRFIYLGVNDLHFSDTQEMGKLATSYDDLIQTYSVKSKLSGHQIEGQVFEWFRRNIAEGFSDKSNEHLKQEFERFKSTLESLQSKISIHSLAGEFATHVSKKTNTKSLGDMNETTFYSNNKGSLLLFNNQPRRQESKDDLLKRVELR